MLSAMSAIFEVLPDIATFLLAILGVSLFFPRELHMLEKPKWKWPSRAAATLFIVIGLGGLISSLVQRHAENVARGKLTDDVAHLKDELEAVQRKLNTDTNATIIPTNFLPPRGAQVIEEGLFQWNVGFVVTQNTARNIHFYAKLQLEDGPGLNDKAIWNKFKPIAIQRMGEHGPDGTLGAGPWDTPNLLLKKKDAEAIMGGTKTIYALAFVQWTNPSGSDGHYQFCLWLQKPNGKILTAQNSAWHSCML
jgi:hypothetical protein